MRNFVPAFRQGASRANQENKSKTIKETMLYHGQSLESTGLAKRIEQGGSLQELRSAMR